MASEKFTAIDGVTRQSDNMDSPNENPQTNKLQKWRVMIALEISAENLCDVKVTRVTLKKHNQFEQNLNSQCDMKSSSLVMPQGDKEMEENIELKSFSLIAPKKSKETEDHLDDMCELTSPNHIYSQDKTSNADILCDLVPSRPVVPKEQKETEDNIDGICVSTSPNLISPQDNEIIVDSLHKLEYSYHTGSKEHKETEDILYGTCKLASPSPISPKYNIEDVNGLCELKFPSFVMPQECIYLEENVDSLFELKPSFPVACTDYKETEDNLDDMYERTSPSLLSPQDNKQNMESLGEIDISSLMASKEHKEAEDYLDEDYIDDLYKADSPSLIFPQDDDENSDRLCNLKPSRLVALKEHKDINDYLDGMREPKSLSLEFPQDNEDSLCDLESSSLVTPKHHKETDNLHGVCELKSPRFVSPEDNEEILHETEYSSPVTPQDGKELEKNVDRLCELEPSILASLKNHKETKDNLDGMCELTSPNLISPQDNKENADRSSEMEYSRVVRPQDFKELEEKDDGLCELESSISVAPKGNEETKNSLDGACEPTFPRFVSPQDNKEQADSLCDLDPPSFMALKEPCETEDNLDVCELTSPSLVSLHDKKKNVPSLAMPQNCSDSGEDVEDLHELESPSFVTSQLHKDLHLVKETGERTDELKEDFLKKEEPDYKKIPDDQTNSSPCHTSQDMNVIWLDSCNEKPQTNKLQKWDLTIELDLSAESLCEVEVKQVLLKMYENFVQNMKSPCDLKPSSLVTPPQGHKEMEENVDNFWELAPKELKETEENLDDASSTLLSLQDNKMNEDSLCDPKTSSLVISRDCNESEWGIDSSHELESHSFAIPQVQKDLYRVKDPGERTDELKDDFLQKKEPDCKKISDDQTKSSSCDTSQDLDELNTRKTTFHQFADKMNMKPYLITKLTLRDILSIDSENVHDKPPKTVEDLPWNYLRKLTDLNRTARDILLEKDQSTGVDVYKNSGGDNDDDDDDNLFNASLVSGDNSSVSVHPLDVLCVLLHCSDSFFQQEIVTKLSICQFAVPLLLPPGDGSHCTLMLWAMRDIVKKWKPQSLADSKGFREENVVNTSMPIFSYVRLGKNKLSKSKILNHVLISAQQHNNFFIHDNMAGGNIERKISDGLVEVSWYFPCGKSDIFPEPIAVTNLRGDLETNWDQFTFLTRISSAVFIFIEDISEREFRLLSSCATTDTQYFFIVTPGPGKTVSTQTKTTLKDLKPVLKLKKSNIIIHDGTENEAEFVKKLQRSIVCFLNRKPKKNMSDLEKEIHGLEIQVDESNPECQKARVLVKEITEEITNVSEYKKNTMKLQGDLWRQLSKVEKELCRMTKQGGKDTQQYQDELIKKRISLHEEQHNHDLPNGLILFVDAITHLSETEKQYFLKWMKFELDSVARDHLSNLQAEYKDKCNNTLLNNEELRQIDQKISDSSLGIEHFLREMGQFYEAECSMFKENKIDKRQFIRLPGIAADLLLDGFPLELIDGDASNIPLRWISDVLTELDIKTERKCRMRVITVLGVQSTGKSTLLNTMFGLQFPVASGRCTRGAFMTLLNVKENFQEELGCDFILVIDTEGLKALELASLEGSYEHDNELATLAVGLSDITIINMAMENTSEMKDILQIVVHAFLRMKEVGKKPSCQFVHQNVSDVSAHEKNMRDRMKLLEQLNEMTKVAAEMEKKSEIKTFSDVMDYNLEKDNWYIPGLWLGVPPMAPVNSGYSEHVSELKKYLLDFMISKASLHRTLTIPEFITWIESLWNAVKHEKFLFSFRNSLVAEAYNKLSTEYSQWEWEFRKTVYDWIIRTETKIRNQTIESLSNELSLEFSNELNCLLIIRKTKMLELLENYFNNKNENVHLIERYKQDFSLSTTSLKEELKRNSLVKLDEAVSIQKGKFKIQNIQNNSQKLIENKITDLLKRCREKQKKLYDEELKKEFEEMWNRTLTDLKIKKLKTRTVSGPMLQQLRNDMSNKGSAVNQQLLRMKDLADITQPDFKMNEKYIESGWFKKQADKVLDKLGLWYRNEHYDKINGFAHSLIDNCNKYIRGKVETGEDYCDNYCQELLHMVTTEISKQSKSLHLSTWFELDIKIHILGKASREFQEMHDKFIKKNDPKLCLEKLKPGYLETFISIFQEKDISQTKAKEFCERCIKPAMMDHVFHHLGQKIVDDIVESSDNKKFSSRTFFQEFLLKELLEEMSLKKYVDYMGQYEEYTKAWILNYTETYVKPQILKPLQEHLLSSLDTKIRAALNEDNSLKSSSVSDFLKSVCEILKEELVIPQTAMQAVTFQNTADVCQFSSDIQLFLQDTITEVLSELQSMDIKSVLFRVTVKPQDELFRKVVGCGKQCPFCKVPCEAGGDEHKEHFATIHRPKGLGTYRWLDTEILTTDICSTSVVSDVTFKNPDTEWKPHPYKEYRTYYPDWAIQPDPSIECSDYWKYIFVMYNEEFAKEYKAKPAEIPDGWKSITKEKALQSLKKMFNS